MQASPQKDTSVLDRVIDILEGSPLNEIALTQAARDAKKLLDTPARDSGYLALGMIAASRMDTENVYRYFDAAALTASDEGMARVVAFNRGLALQRIFHFEEEADYFKKLHESHRDDIEYLIESFDTAAGLLRISDVNTFLSRMEQLQIDKSILVKRSANKAGKFQDSAPLESLMKQNGITESDITALICSVGLFLKKYKIPFSGNSIRILDTGEVQYQYKLPISHDRAAEISFEIAMHVIETFANPLSDIITFSCISNADNT